MVTKVPGDIRKKMEKDAKILQVTHLAK